MPSFSTLVGRASRDATGTPTHNVNTDPTRRISAAYDNDARAALSERRTNSSLLHVCSLGKVAHKRIDLISVAQVQVVLAIGEHVQLRLAITRDILSEPLGVL